VQSGNPYYMSVVEFVVSPWGMGWVEGYEGDNNQMILTRMGREPSWPTCLSV
jgi:hypothetical protein